MQPYHAVPAELPGVQRYTAMQVRHRLQLLAPSPQLPAGMAGVPGYTLLAAGSAVAALNESAAMGPLSSGPRMVLLDSGQALAALCHQQVCTILAGTTQM